LFGDFPYGRPSAGSPEDLARVDRGDLMLARDRFLNSNNATLAIVGAVNRQKVLRTLKQLFGPWRKSEQIVPSSFSAAKAPNARALIVNVPSPTTEIRLAWRGVARPDNDYYAAQVLARVAQNRWQAAAPELASKPLFVRSESYLLPGMIVMGTAVNQNATIDSIATAKKIADSLSTTPIAPNEIERARKELLDEGNTALSKPESLPDSWLDMDTYRLTAAQERSTAIQSISPGDVQRVANRLLKDAPVATVIAGDAAQLKPLLQSRVQFEVFGETPSTGPNTKPPTKPATPSSPR